MSRGVLLMVLLLYVTCAFGQYRKYSFQQPKMGSPFNVLIYYTDSAQAAEAASIAFALADSLNQVYSDYLPDSELNRLCNQSGNGK